LSSAVAISPILKMRPSVTAGALRLAGHVSSQVPERLSIYTGVDHLVESVPTLGAV